jgi:hypothetical protein
VEALLDGTHLNEGFKFADFVHSDSFDDGPMEPSGHGSTADMLSERVYDRNLPTLAGAQSVPEITRPPDPLSSFITPPETGTQSSPVPMMQFGLCFTIIFQVVRQYIYCELSSLMDFM